ncbi:MAG: ABC transporter permease [Peptostreptococcaceae bacterium]|nr:ABC transporter permease [Peptostreptococcaceae bacterium]
MIKLIRLEMKMVEFPKFILGAFITMLAMSLLLLLMFVTDNANQGEISNQFFMVVDSMMCIACIIFAGVFISRLIIDEYRDKTIMLMFTYPIARKKIMIAKFVLVFLFTFSFIVISRFLVMNFLTTINSQYDFLPQSYSITEIFRHCLNTIGFDLASSGISLVPLFFGMRKKSTAATIVSSSIISSFSNGNFGDLHLGEYIGYTLGIGVIGIFIVYLSIRKIEYKDLLS